MPDDKNDNLNDMAKSSDSLRARKINSLHRSVEDIVHQQNRRRIQTDNQIKEAGLSSETEKNYDSILKSLGRTISNLATGVKTITTETGKATTDAIGQYGRAVGEDISINKTNTVAMALSKSTPLFGYFAAKFMETDVFKDATTRIKNNIGSALSEGMSKAGSGISSIFHKGKQFSDEHQPATSSDLEKLRASIDQSPPKLQTGGYVRQGGLAELHAAEVVTPIDKLLKQIDEAKSADISRKLNSTLEIMSDNVGGLEDVILHQQKQQQSVLQTFVTEFKKNKESEESGTEQLLNSINELKAGLIGSADRTRVAWQQTLLDHPTFRNLKMAYEILSSAMLSPIKYLFGIRGGYAGDVNRAMSSSNMFLKQANLLALIYTTMMPKLDNISQYTKAAAEGITGEKIVPGNINKTYTMFEKIRAKLTSRTLPGQEETSWMHRFAKQFGLDEDVMKEAGIGGLKDFLRPQDIMGKMGASRENIKSKFMEDEEWDTLRSFIGKFSKRMRETEGYAAGKSRDKKRWDQQEKQESFFTSVKEYLRKLTKMKSDQEEREGPHSPSMAENIASTTRMTDDHFKENMQNEKEKKGIFQKIKESSFMQLDFMNKLTAQVKKLRSWFWDALLFAGGFIKNIFFSGLGSLKNWIKAGLGAIGLGGLVKNLKGFLGKGGSKLKGLFGLGASANPYAAAVEGATAKKGILGVAGRMGAKVAGIGAGGIMGVGMGLWDMARAIISGDEVGFVGNFITRGLAGFLGGRDSGLSGAISGAMKGGGLGFAAGAVTGPGAFISGALGAAAGGILGFVGGANLSKAINKTMEGISNITSAIWKMIKFPFQLIREGLQSFGILLKYQWNKATASFRDWWEKDGIIQKGLHWITDKISFILGYIKKPFVGAANMIKSLIDGFSLRKGFINNLKAFGNALLNFPKYLLQDTYEKLSKIPVIGKYIKKSMDALGGFVKDVQTGELSDKLGESLGQETNMSRKAQKIRDEKTAQLSKQYTPTGTGRMSQEGTYGNYNINYRTRGKEMYMTKADKRKKILVLNNEIMGARRDIYKYRDKDAFFKSDREEKRLNAHLNQLYRDKEKYSNTKLLNEKAQKQFRIDDIKNRSIEKQLNRIKNIPKYSSYVPEDIKKQLNQKPVKDATNFENRTGGILVRDNVEKTVDLKLEKQRNEDLKKELENIKEGTNGVTQAMLQNHNTSVNSSNTQTSNVVNNNGGGGQQKLPFSGANMIAHEIVSCHID